MTYDDERVVALLKESVPAAPDAPGRVDAVRRLAARQRSFVQYQVLGAAASIVLVLAAVTAVAKPGGGSAVAPVADPGRRMATALGEERTARFELRTTVKGETGKPVEARAYGVVRFADGALELRGSAPTFLGQEGEPDDPDALMGISIDGAAYRPAKPEDELPPGKKWVRTGSLPSWRAADFRRFLGFLPGSLSDVRHTGDGELRGVRVAHYSAKTSGAFLEAEGRSVDVTFSVDEQGRPRRFAGTIGTEGVKEERAVTMSLELYDYGVPVDVTAPPVEEIADESESEGEGEGEVVELQPPTADPQSPEGRRLATCAAEAASQAALTTCLEQYERAVRGVECDGRFVPARQSEYWCSDGTFGPTP